MSKRDHDIIELEKSLSISQTTSEVSIGPIFDYQREILGMLTPGWYILRLMFFREGPCGKFGFCVLEDTVGSGPLVYESREQAELFLRDMNYGPGSVLVLAEVVKLVRK